MTSLKGHYNLNSAAVRVGVTVSDGVRNKNKLHLWLRRTFDITVFRYGGPEPDQNRGGEFRIGTSLKFLQNVL